MDKKDGGVKTEKLFNFRPVFFLALSLCLGIVFYFYCYFNGVSAQWLFYLIPLAVTPFFFCRTRKKTVQTAVAVVALILSFFVGYFGLSLQLAEHQEGETKVGEKLICGRVVEKREYKEYTGCVLDLLEFDGKQTNGKLIAYLPTSFFDKVEYCDLLLMQGEVHFKTLNGENFALQANSLGEEIRFSVWTEEAQIVGNKFDLFLFLRARAEKTIEAGMDETPASVTKGVLFGNTSAIDDDLYENVRKGGIAHIFAVSGLHVGALFGFCLLLTKKTVLRKASKIFRFLFLAVLLFLYAGICGFSASVVRATVICLAAYAASLLGVKSDLLESLGLAAIVILLWKPSSLFEIGFQLSFFACLGIAFLSRPIGQVFDEIRSLWRKVFPKIPTKAEMEAKENDDTLPLTIWEKTYKNVRDFFSASLGAQIFTAPLLLCYFGYVSGWALILNCIFVPLVSVAFSLLLLLVAIACLFPLGISFVFLYLPNVIWSVLLLIFQVFGFSSFAISGSNISLGAIIAYYSGCIFFTDKWNLKRGLSVTLALMCFVAFAITMVALNI